jgi:dCMP deaminase
MTFLNDIENLVENNKNRLSWNDYFASVALLISSRSPSPKLKVGAVIVNNNRIISSGYNGFPHGSPHISITRNNHEVNTIHAEQNAISDAACRGASVNFGKIYITHFPCLNCMKYIISSGIKNIYYINDYNNDEIVYKLAETSNVFIEKI